MELNPDVAKQIEEIRQDRTHGASRLSRQAISTLNLASKKSEAKNAADFLEELKAVARELIETKPSMASITSCVSRFIHELSQKCTSEKDLASLKSFALSKCNEVAKESEKAFLKTTEQGAELIEKGDELMTCSYSSTICQTFRAANLKGKVFNVVVAESRFGSKVYGKLAAEQIQAYGISAEIIPDSAIGYHISKVNKVFVGADSISADGSITNGTPTGAVALAARKSQVPFYSLCETTKFDVKNHLGQPGKLEEGFDIIPPYLITGIVTEEGIIKPEEVINYIRKIVWAASIP